MRRPGLLADRDEPVGSVVQSMGSVNYNRSNTSSMATLPHFPKQRPVRHSACVVAVNGCDMVFCMADTGTISSGPVFISRDGCTVVAYCHC